VTSPGVLAANSGFPSTDGKYHLRYPAGDAPLGASLVASAVAAILATGAISGGGTDPNQLPVGHYVVGKLAPAVVYPRPDSETGTFGSGTVYARHRWAYYDGIHSVEYVVPIGVQGGTRPWKWALTVAPPGATIGAGWTAQNPGVVRWTPTQAYSTSSPANFTVTATDQVGNTITISWTVATSSSTNQFIFVSPSNNASPGNDSTGDGSIGNPFATLAKVMGTTAAASTYPGRIVVMRGGNLAWPLFTDSTLTGFSALDKTLKPIAYVTFPGENVTIDGSAAGLYDTGAGTDDLFYGGSATGRLTINGTSATSASAHTFRMYNPNRVTWFNIDFTNPISRANDGMTNSTSTFGYNNSTSSGGVGIPGKNYWFMYGCTESGRLTGANNSMLLCCWFSVGYFVVEYCNATGYAGFGTYFKDANVNGTVYNSVFNNLEQAGGSFHFGGQNGESPVVKSQNLEICYCFCKGGPLWFDHQSGAIYGLTHSYRNTILNQFNDFNYGLGNWTPAGQGPLYSDNDVIVARSPGGISTAGGQPVTATGTEVQVAWSGTTFSAPSNMPFDAVTGNLVNVAGGTQWRSLYFGTHGHELG